MCGSIYVYILIYTEAEKAQTRVVNVERRNLWEEALSRTVGETEAHGQNLSEGGEKERVCLRLHEMENLEDGASAAAGQDSQQYYGGFL